MSLDPLEASDDDDDDDDDDCDDDDDDGDDVELVNPVKIAHCCSSQGKMIKRDDGLVLAIFKYCNGAIYF